MAEGGGEGQATGARASTLDVFISYASQDAALADAIVADLERHGLRCWVAPRSVMPGEVYADAIVRALNGARTLVLVLTVNSATSPHVLREVERASAKRHSIIPFRIDSASLPPALEYFLSTSHWLDASASGVDAAMPKLVEAVKRLVAHVVPSIDALNTADGGSPGPAQDASADIGKGKSIAVLPFADMSEKKDQEYLAEGMAEEIRDLLAKIPAIRVIGRTSSSQFKGKNEDIRTIGAKLSVAYVLEGSVRKAANRVRVAAQLINVKDGMHHWSETYDQDMGDVLKMQDEIAAAVVRALQITVGVGGLRSRRSLPNPEAYNLYLRGRYAYDRFDKEGSEEAASYYQLALELDPTFADAAVALALTYAVQARHGFVSPGVGFEQARRAAEAALKLDPTAGRAHAILGMVHAMYDWDWSAADREFKTALNLKPHDPLVLDSAGPLTLALGQYASASRLFKERLARDPLQAPAYVYLSWAQIRLGQVAEAEASMRKVLEIKPRYVGASYFLGIVLLARGDPDAALTAMGRDNSAFRIIGLPVVYWALGREAEADAALRKLIAEHADRYAFYIAGAYAYRADRDEAFKWLERAYAQKDPCLAWIKGDPLLANLEVDPRYKAFLRKMNLPVRDDVAD